MPDIQQMNGFDLDANRDQTVWRYLDFPRLLSLLLSNELPFIQPDSFGDPWEGMPNLSDSKILLEKNQTHLSRPQLQQYAISCWHMHQNESAAMWDKYASKGFLVQSSVGRLVDSLKVADRKLMVGRVMYKNPGTSDWVSDFPECLFQKREEYFHEEEFRIIITLSTEERYAIDHCKKKDCDGWGIVQTKKDEYSLLRTRYRTTSFNGVRPLKNGLPAAVDLNRLIDAIYTSPSLPDWVEETLKVLLDRLGIEKVVTASDFGQPHPLASTFVKLDLIDKD
jgi:hypothetical protein